MHKRAMPISSRWLQGAILTYLVGFTILGVLAYLVYAEQPPIPSRVVTPRGETVFTAADVRDGMNVFQKYGVMEYGSVYGHGAYLGPDFTAQYLHRSAGLLAQRYAPPPPSRPAAVGAFDDPGNLASRDVQFDAPAPTVARVAAELHANAYDAVTDTLVWSNARADAHRLLVAGYQRTFRAPVTAFALQAKLIEDPEEVRKLAAFFAWTAWTATANRPGLDYSYTNNWPPEPIAGNTLTPQAVTWSVISIIGLLGGMGLVLYFFGRYDWLGWTSPTHRIHFAPPEQVAPTPGQRATVWFMLVASVLFLGQTLLGGVAAHYRAEPSSFFGLDASRFLPFNIARTWHVQLSIFWVAASYIATGIFLAPFITGREPKRQRLFTLLLLGAVALVVFGSLAGEYFSVAGWLEEGSAWYWLGHQGWEYLDLGRFWQILLILGLAFWVFILGRGLARSLRVEGRGNMPWLLFYAALAIPAFYAVGLLAGRRDSFVVADFWRFWVVHLWVEDFLELFTTVIVAYLFVLLGMVREQTATRVIYLEIILYSIGGVVGTMHHLYFSGAPAAHMALGAAFSALEVIPLLLLTLEAWAFIRAGEKSMADRGHPHRWAVWFLVAAGVWNFLGAGVFGFLINLPVVSYYEIGTGLTANHAHTSMMGVYGMLAIGMLLFCIRFTTRPEKWSDRAAKLSFWSLNIGLTWMAFANLFPVGVVQLSDAVGTGYWHARSEAFLATPWVRALEWSRLPGDLLFIFGGAVPLLWLCVQAVRFPQARTTEPELVLPPLYEIEEVTAAPGPA